MSALVGRPRTGTSVTTSESPAPVLSAPDLSDPLYTIEHLARLFFVELDTAREYTNRKEFSEPIKIGRRWLWVPEEVLAWAREQKRYAVEDRKRTPAQAPKPEPEPKAPRPYKQRASQPVVVT